MSANFKTKHTELLTQEITSALYKKFRSVMKGNYAPHSVWKDAGSSGNRLAQNGSRRREKDEDADGKVTEQGKTTKTFGSEFSNKGSRNMS